MNIIRRLMSTMVTLGVFAVFAPILLMTGPAQAVDLTFAKPRPIYAPGEVLVKFKPTATSQARSRVSNKLASVGTQAIGKSGVALIKLSGTNTVDQAVAAARLDANVEYAQPNYLYYPSIAPNDTNYGQLWGLKNTGQTITDPTFPFYNTNNPGTIGSDINAETAWDHITDCSAVVVAVLDTGINYTHQDLAPNMWDGGVASPNHGFDFVDNDNDPMPPVGSESHGTHVAGTVGARGNNAIGTTGVCWQVRIMSVRVLGPNGGSTARIIQGIEFASNNGAKVINMSLGGEPGAPFDQAFSDSITFAQNQDVVVVVAAGNDANDNEMGAVYPCSHTQENIVCVAALDQAYALADFSNWGSTTVDVGAPGTNIRSSWPGPQYDEVDLTGWSVVTDQGTGWFVNTSCPGFLVPLLLNPNNNSFCSGTSLYANNTDATAYKTFDLSGATSASVSYRAKHDLELDLACGPTQICDFVNVYARGAGGRPDGVGGTAIGGFAGQSLNNGGTIDFLEREHVIPSACFTATCSVGFRLLSDNIVTRPGAALLLLNVSAVRDNADEYDVIDGTSMASPHVAGLAALVRAFNPNYTFTDTVNAIKNGGRSVLDLTGITTTGKAVDALGSLAYINAPQGVTAVVQ